MLLVKLTGKISATAGDIDSAVTANSNNLITSGGVAGCFAWKRTLTAYTDTNLDTLINTGFIRWNLAEIGKITIFPTAHFGTVLEAG